MWLKRLHSLLDDTVACDLRNRFEEACSAYTDGGRPELGLALLQQLADNAVLQCRFADAAHGYYKLAVEALKVSLHQLHAQIHCIPCKVATYGVAVTFMCHVHPSIAASAPCDLVRGGTPRTRNGGRNP
jgi:hypothetical protein